MRLLCGESLLKEPRYSRAAMLDLQCSSRTSTAVSLILSSSFITRSPLFFFFPYPSHPAPFSLSHTVIISQSLPYISSTYSPCVSGLYPSVIAVWVISVAVVKRGGGGSPLFRLPPAISLLLDSNQERKHWCESLHQANLYVLDHMGSPCLCSRVDFVSRAWKYEFKSDFLCCFSVFVCFPACLCMYAWMNVCVCVHRLVRGLPLWLQPYRTSRGQSQNGSTKSRVIWKLPYWRNISYVSMHTLHFSGHLFSN